ncbi:hypothetical protein [Nocardioides sp. SLBN-35]|uniref:hypothetical protein n=1 Tax=Nocardioides sp. SLBN-35 TaxID=2768445 RepID=UPI001151F087|nr:hypothetical protein [Nocardioides sp. SLBN-35]TQK73322.1 hypothetical protein FBY23_5153 [Nocardioides sp. SLBN-35]
MTKPSELDDDQWQSVMEGLLLAQYSLVLGAGASMGSTNAAGHELPTGNGLRDELLAEYDIPDDGAGNLRLVYDLAATIAQNSGGTAPKDFICPRFTHCTVPDWYADLVAVPWRMIWNLNIDDVATRAFQDRYKSRAKQQLSSLSWRDPWNATRNPMDRVSMVHLHGDSLSRDLVFGSLEYLAAAKEGGAAHKIFWDEWSSGVPVVAVGASLDDELDLAAPLLSRVDSERPRLVVKPSFTEYEEFRFKQSGIIAVRMKAEEFFRSVADDTEAALARIGEDQAIESTGGINPLAMAFYREFRSPTYRADRWHDIYDGDEPTWQDLRDNLPFERTLVERLSPSEPFRPKGLNVLAFHGELSGTTTAEMSYLHEVENAGVGILEHNGDVTLNAKAIHWMAKVGMRKVLRVERLVEFVDAVSELEALCARSGVAITLVTSVRTARLPQLKLRLGDSLIAAHVVDDLEGDEVGRLLAKLDSKKRLNVLAGMPRAEQVKYLQRRHRSSLVDGLAAITRGRSFAARYEEAYADVTDPVEIQVLRLLLTASEVRHEIPMGVLARAVDADFRTLNEVLSSERLSRLAQVTAARVSVRHMGLAAEAAKRTLSVEDRRAATTALARALGPYVQPMAITLRTREVTFVARLMDARRIVEAFGSETAAEFYDDLEADFQWNSRFWEQRALAELESEAPRWSRAEAWAREAVRRHEDGLSLNTLATVLLRGAVVTGTLDEDAFFEGLDTVDAARVQTADRVTEHPYITALHYLRRGRAVARDEAQRRRIDAVFNFWRVEVERSAAWSHAGMRLDMERAISEYVNGM